ncbi:hypothetical protein D5F01_LYC12162 [Larimichthys crocea]|uniref:Uncharacterized protein n=1 Tax=Larimichthys crocea TaxID=215358 RepID=A0A6G0IAB8_LARCR|nr:hypothetical protein D5F01_LYC12162 [Larimichthys crocea]
MDGEFDRETGDGGWGPSSSYKTVTEQLLEMQRVVRSMHGSKDTDEIMKQMREDVSKVLLEKGKTEKDKGLLGKLFWAEAKVAGKEQERAGEEEKKGGWLKKGKKRDAQREAEKRNQKWNRWAMWWQAAQHTMTEQPKKTLTKDLTPAPPPYAPATPSAPTNPPPTPAGMYPALQITAGKLYIDHVPSEEELDNTSVTGYACSMSSECSGSSDVSSVRFKNLPTPCKTSYPKGAEGHDISVLFSDRVLREDRAEILKEMSRREAAVNRQLQELEEAVRQQIRGGNLHPLVPPPLTLERDLTTPGWAWRLKARGGRENRRGDKYGWMPS